MRLQIISDLHLEEVTPIAVVVVAMIAVHNTGKSAGQAFTRLRNPALAEAKA
jgi:hypothetical protein